MHAPILRRDFLRDSMAAAAALATTATAATARGFAANETINIACIGTGGRCRKLMENLAGVWGTRIAAVCDVWDEHLELGRKLADPKAVAVKDYRRVLDRDDIDAVLIGAPDHWHVPLMVAACEAGKDVYVEKPLTHDLTEGRLAIDAQNKHQRIVQVGTQQRSMPQFQAALEIIRSGQLGSIHKVHCTWNRNQARYRVPQPKIDPKTVDWKMFLGNAPEQAFDPYRFRNWRWFWDFGGGILTDLMVHFIDIAYWYLDLDHPAMATTVGDHFKVESLWETPDTIQTLLRYPKQRTQVYFEGTFVNARNAAMIEFMGERGTLYLDRGRFELHPERNAKLDYAEYIIGEGPRGADFYLQPNGELLHLTNWVECMRTREKPNAPAEAGVAAAAAAHLGNMAYRANQVAHWDETAG